MPVHQSPPLGKIFCFNLVYFLHNFYTSHIHTRLANEIPSHLLLLLLWDVILTIEEDMLPPHNSKPTVNHLFQECVNVVPRPDQEAIPSGGTLPQHYKKGKLNYIPGKRQVKNWLKVNPHPETRLWELAQTAQTHPHSSQWMPLPVKGSHCPEMMPPKCLASSSVPEAHWHTAGVTIPTHFMFPLNNPNTALMPDFIMNSGWIINIPLC